MKRGIFLLAGILLILVPSAAYSNKGVAIQRVISNTRSELGQLATSSKANEITELMKKFDTQYETWIRSCGSGERFDPKDVSDACREMAGQMRETGIALYGKLAEYLPDVAARYEQGARWAKRIIEEKALDATPAALYQSSLDGVSDSPSGSGNILQDVESPFDLEMGDFADPTEKMFAALEKLVPDFGKEVPDAVRAGTTHVGMMKKAERARYLAKEFEKAKFVLESQREYGEIIFNTTEAVGTMPNVLGIQYAGSGFKAKPNRAVLDYYSGNKASSKGAAAPKDWKMGGFEPRK
jgi:hypothetical protein